MAQEGVPAKGESWGFGVGVLGCGAVAPAALTPAALAPAALTSERENPAPAGAEMAQKLEAEWLQDGGEQSVAEPGFGLAADPAPIEAD